MTPLVFGSRALGQTADQPGDAGTITLPTVEVTANQQGAGGGPATGDPTGTGPGESGGRFTGYNAVDAIAATKTDTPILQTPVSVQVVTRQTMDDQQDISIQDALVGNVSSVYQSPQNNSGAFAEFTIRGFDTGTNNNGSLYYNGLQVAGTVNAETANVQSFQVLKGPAAILFGRVEPGGIIWVQSKRPQDVPYYSIQEQAGAFGTTRTTIDTTGPLTADKTWLYRFNADVSNINQYTDFIYSKNLFLSPAITYHPIEQFKLFIEGEYRDVVQPLSFGNNVVLDGWNTPAPGVPIGRFLGDPSLVAANPFVRYDRQLYYDWTYDISPNWTLTNRGLYLDTYQFASFSQPVSCFCANSMGVLSNFGLNPTNVGLSNDWGAGPNRTLDANLDLTGKFATGLLQHAVLLGADVQSFESPVQKFIIGDSPYPAGLNLYNPIYFPSSFSFSDPNNFTLFNHEASLWKGVYAQDMMSAMNDSVHLLVGGRYDWADIGNLLPGAGLTAQSAEPLSFVEDRAFSPRVGLLYQPLPWLSFYGNYSTSFGQNNGVNPADHTILPPQKGLQWEGGAKAEFFDKRLSVSMAFYDIFKSNIPTPDPTNPNNTLLIGLAQSKGVEFDMTGKVNDNWSLIANYSHDEAKVVTGQPINPLDPTNQVFELPQSGNYLASVPANAANFWVTYSADGDFKGLNISGGVNVVGSRWGDNANSFTIPAYALVNGGISYRFPWQGAKVTAQVNVSNLLDTAYYVSAGSRINVVSGNPRSILGSLRLEF
jgi:iron complex outermembrane receptor protein